jgi:uncharacterized protein (UPF0335 family)
MARKPKQSSEDAAAGPGHNSGVTLTEEQRRALLLNGVKKIEDAQDQLETIKSNIRNLRKILKSDGFERFEVDYALRLRKVDETEELDKRRREARIAQWLNHAIGTQPDLFSDEPDRTPSVDKAYEDGKIAGMEGQTCSPPSHLGQEQNQQWIKGCCRRYRRGRDASRLKS